MKLQTPSDLARLVRNARAQQGLTQQDIAEAAGITRQSVARLERGNGGVSFDTVLRILDHLGIGLDAITERRATASTAPPASGAAQAAAEALAKRPPPLPGAGPIGTFNTQALASLTQIPLDTAALIEQVRAGFDSAALTSIRDASRILTEYCTTPGSDFNASPGTTDSASTDAVRDDSDSDHDAAGDAV